MIINPFYINKNRHFEVGVTQEIGITGFFGLTVRNPDLTVKKEITPFKNKITTLALNFIGSNTPPGIYNDYLGAAYVGTGTTPPSSADTQMFAPLATASNVISRIQTVNVGVDHYVSLLKTYRYAPGAAAGNLTEVGVGWAASSLGNLWSRQLIVDGAGNPVTLTVLSNEYLDVTYELRLYPDLTTHTGILSLTGGSSYEYETSASTVGNWSLIETYQSVNAFLRRPGAVINSVIGSSDPAATGSLNTNYTTDRIVLSSGTPQSNGGFGDVGTFDTYIPNSFYNIRTSRTFGTADANFPSGLIAFSTDYYLNFSGKYSNTWVHSGIFLDKIPKTIDNTVNFKTKTSWAERILP